MFAFQQAPFFDADEKAHLGYAHVVADLRLPEIDTVPDVPPSATQWLAERATASDDRYRGVWVANHPPLHYVAVAPLIWLSDGLDRADGGLLFVRLANGAFAAAGVLFTYLLARDLSGGIRRIGVAAAAIVALVPQGHTYFGRGLNDGLAFAAGAAVVWAGICCLTGSRSPGEHRRDLVVLGITVAVAAGARTATMLMAIGVVAAVAVHELATGPGTWPARLRSALRSAAIGIGPATLLFGWFYVRIHVLYGDPGASSYLLDYFGRVREGSIAETMTRGGMWSHLFHRMTSTAPLSWAWPRFANAIGAIAAVGLVVLLVLRRPGDRTDDGERPRLHVPAIALCIGCVGLVTVLVAQHIAGGGSPYPRYFFPALGVMAALAAMAFDRLVPRLLPVMVVAVMAWWAIRQMPIGVEPAAVPRPRDGGAGAPMQLRVLPVGDGWRIGAAAAIVAGGVLAAGALTIGLVRPKREAAS